MQHECFEDVCTCQCNDVSSVFDEIITTETKFSVRLIDLCHSNVGWLSDKSVCDHHLKDWRLAHKQGVYLLWHKNGYCNIHELFHMRCLYVGKGVIPTRFATHWKKKDFSEQLLVYWTFVPMANRQAKYVEQLLLDLFAIPLNKSEKVGSVKLCAYLTQDEVD